MIIKFEEDYYDPEDNKDFSDYDDYDDDVRETFAKDLFDLLTDIIKLDKYIIEKFTSDKNEVEHFKKHCVGKENAKSSKGKILYDFTDSSQYSEYEKKITSEIQNTDMIIDSLDDYEEIMKCMRKLFEGNCAVTFTKSCGLKDETGHISLSFCSYSSSVTTNYDGGNTIDVCIKGKKNRTVTLYAVDTHKLQNRLNNIIKNDVDPEDVRSFYFNND